MRYSGAGNHAFNILILLVLFVTTACTIKNEDNRDDVLRISMKSSLHDQKHILEPLQQYLEKELSMKVEFVKYKDMYQQYEQFRSAEIDLTMFCGYGFVQAFKDGNADPLVMRDVDFHFTSYFVTHTENKVSSIAELQGQTMSFTSRLSTTGHVMPRFFLSTQEIVPEQFFSNVYFSGSHKQSAIKVQNKEVDVAAVSSQVIDRLFSENILDGNKVKILWKTPPYPNYVWTARRNLPEHLKNNIIEAFIKLSAENPQQRELLVATGANHYFPANSNDFEPLKKIVAQLDMLKSYEK